MVAMDVVRCLISIVIQVNGWIDQKKTHPETMLVWVRDWMQLKGSQQTANTCYVYISDKQKKNEPKFDAGMLLIEIMNIWPYFVLSPPYFYSTGRGFFVCSFVRSSVRSIARLVVGRFDCTVVVLFNSRLLPYSALQSTTLVVKTLKRLYSSH